MEPECEWLLLQVRNEGNSCPRSFYFEPFAEILINTLTEMPLSAGIRLVSIVHVSTQPSVARMLGDKSQFFIRQRPKSIVKAMPEIWCSPKEINSPKWGHGHDA